MHEISAVRPAIPMRNSFRCRLHEGLHKHTDVVNVLLSLLDIKPLVPTFVASQTGCCKLSVTWQTFWPKSNQQKRKWCKENCCMLAKTCSRFHQYSVLRTALGLLLPLLLKREAPCSMMLWFAPARWSIGTSSLKDRVGEGCGDLRAVEESWGQKSRAYKWRANWSIKRTQLLDFVYKKWSKWIFGSPML